MYELKKMEKYLRVNLLRLGPRLMKKIINRTALSQSLRSTALVFRERTRNLVKSDLVYLQMRPTSPFITILGSTWSQSGRFLPEI